MLLSSSKYYLKAPYEMVAEGYVVHNTANDAPAKNEISYMINNNYEVSFHIAIDDKEIWQGVPFNRNTWNAGDGNGKGNRKMIAIEICYSKSGGERFIQAEKNTAKYLAENLHARGWGIDRVYKHQDFNGKYCPHRTLDMGWQRFLNMVQAELDKLAVPQEKPKEEIKDSYYRVRKSWDDPSSQLGAFVSLDNAIRLAKGHDGYKVFDAKGKVVYPQETAKFDPKMTNVQLACLVWAGEFGNGEEREQALGNRYDKVQALVENGVGKFKTSSVTNDALADEVMQRLWGDGAERRNRLEAFGFNYDAVQKAVMRKYY